VEAKLACNFNLLIAIVQTIRDQKGAGLETCPSPLLKMFIWSRNCPYVVFLQWNKNSDLPLNGNLVFLLLW